MYERFSDKAREAMQRADQQVRTWQHEYIGTEHILMGLLQLRHELVIEILGDQSVTSDAIITIVNDLVQPGPGPAIQGKYPQTPRAKKVIEYSMEEARGLNHNYVGVEHILLGLLRENEGVAANALYTAGVRLDLARESVEARSGGYRQPVTEKPAILRPTKSNVLLARGKGPDADRLFEEAILRWVREVGASAVMILAEEPQQPKQWTAEVPVAAAPPPPPAGDQPST